jgi:hypothetical protein
MSKPVKKQLKFYATPDEQAWVEAHGGPTAAISILIRDAIARETEPPALAAAVRDLATMVERLAASGWTTTLVAAPITSDDDDDTEKLKAAFSLF